MAEEKTEVVLEEKIETPTNNPFDETHWSNEPLVKEAKTEEPKKEEPKTETTTVVEEDEVFDEDKYVKDKWGWDSAELGKKEVEALREKAKQYDITDEESRKVISYIKEGKRKELYNFLHEQEQIDKLSNADLSDLKAAEELVKFGIGNKNKNLTEDEIDFLFNEKFSIPRKPVQGDDLDEEYEQKVDAWKSHVENVQKRLRIEAKLAQPELAQLKKDLTLPEINQGVDPKAQEAENQKILEAAEKVREQYLSVLKSDAKNFNGFNVTYKDETVEIPLSLNPPDEEKVALAKELENFDVDEYILSRWFTKEGKPNVQQIMEDKYLLDNRAKVLQKLVNDAGNKRLEMHLKTKSQIDVNGKTDKTFNQNGEKTNQEKMEEFFWNQS